MKPIYVAFITKDGIQGWMLNPKPFFDGRLWLSFSVLCPTAGVVIKLKKFSIKELTIALQDELDRLKVPWSNCKHGRYGTKVVGNKTYSLHMMDIVLTGPLPLEVAEKTEGKVVRKPVKIMSRFGG